MFHTFAYSFIFIIQYSDLQTLSAAFVYFSLSDIVINKLRVWDSAVKSEKILTNNRTCRLF